MAYQNYLFSNRKNDTHIKIYAYSLEQAMEKMEQYAKVGEMLYCRTVDNIAITEPVNEVYERSFFEALLLHKGLYGAFVKKYEFDYMEQEGELLSKEKFLNDCFFTFEDGIVYQELWTAMEIDGITYNDWGFLGDTKDSFNQEVVALLKSIGYELITDKGNEDYAFSAMTRREILPLNLPNWCNDFIF